MRRASDWEVGVLLSWIAACGGSAMPMPSQPTPLGRALAMPRQMSGRSPAMPRQTSGRGLAMAQRSSEDAWEAPRHGSPGAPPRTTPPARLHVGCEPGQPCPPAVGMLVLPGVPEPERCTATLIAPDRVLTASHCLPREARRAGAACPNAWVLFPGSEGAPQEWVGCDRVISVVEAREPNVLRPEHAVLQLVRPAVRRPLAIASAPAEPGSIVTVVSVTPHPLHNGSHRLAARLCRVEGLEAAIEALGEQARQVGWLSGCPIERGNSGSPVLDRSGRIRAIVHGGTDRVSAWGVTSDVSGAAL